VNRNVVDRAKGTPVWETSTRLGFSTAASLGTALMVPEATDRAAVANRHTPSQLGIPDFSGPMRELNALYAAFARAIVPN
jgi:hypothetical protein